MRRVGGRRLTVREPVRPKFTAWRNRKSERSAARVHSLKNGKAWLEEHFIGDDARCRGQRDYNERRAPSIRGDRSLAGAQRQ